MAEIALNHSQRNQVAVPIMAEIALNHSQRN